MPRAFIGISGYDYPGWRGSFYPADIPKKEWLVYASRRFSSIELNGTFYSLKSPAVFERWATEAPGQGFVFAIKGSRFITHNLKLRNHEVALGNFFASGILALGRKTGPFLWQLPATYSFQPDRIDGFIRSLPRSSAEAKAVARQHDHRLRRGALVDAAVRVRYRHAFEVRHPSYFHEEFYAILREHGCGFVIADTAGKFEYAEVVTARFVYVRLHGSRALYRSNYTESELQQWAGRVRHWMGQPSRTAPRDKGCDVYVYFDNDAKVHAPHNAMRLLELVGE